MLEELKSRINSIYMNNNYSNELKSRIEKEVEIIGWENLGYLLKIKDILDRNYNYSHSISGTINSFYIAYFLGITCFNPIRYEIINDTKVTVSINIPEKEKSNLFNILSKELKIIKKINNTGSEKGYSGFIFDKSNTLVTYKTGVVKAKKKDLINQYFIINVYEKQILSLLSKMYYGNNNVFDFFLEENIIKLKEKMNNQLKHQTPFEIIINNLNKINIKQLIKNNECFHILHIDQVILEYKLTLFKYLLPRMYYITYLECLSNKVNIDIISKYKDNFKLFFKENNDELTLEYKFYCLWYDARCNNDLTDLDITIINNKISISYHNIQNIYSESVEDKFSKLQEIITSNYSKEIDIFGYEGNDEYYLSNIIAKELGIHSFQVASYLNPLSGGKVFFDSEFYKKIDEDKYLKIINFYKTIPLFLHTERYEKNEEIIDGILSCTDSVTNIIIIDNYEELIKQSRYSESKILDILNKLNKKIFMFHKVCKSNIERICEGK